VQSTVTFTVTPVVDIVADTVTTNEDTSVVITVNSNDSFENSGHTVTAINGTAIGVGASVAVSNGSVTLNADGTLSFTPAANFNGATSFSYTVTSGGVTETANVTVNVTPVNDAPVPSEPIPPTPGQSFDPATGNYTAETQEDVAFSGQVAATDADGNPLTYTVSTQPTHGTVTLNATTGVYTYTPTADYNGTDSFVVQISDGNGGVVQSTVTFTVTPVVDIVADTVTTNEDTSVVITVNSNDSFENSGHTVTAINGTAIGVGASVAVSNGSVTLNADGTLSFTPAANFNGATSFSYTVTSGGVTETANVTVNVTPVNDAPVPSEPIPPTPGQSFDPATGNYTAETQEDVAFSGQVAATDADGNPLTYTVSTQPTHGTVTLNATTGVYTYTPTADYNGTDSFVVQISDGNGGVVQSTVTFTVTPVTDIVADTVTTNEDTSVVITVNSNDSFENSGHTVTAINGTAIGVGASAAVSNGSVILNADGTLSFTPAANFNGATSFSYTVTSGGVTETANVTVNVTPVNDPPVPVNPGTQGQTFNPTTGNYAATTPEDIAFNGQVAATDADGDALAYNVVGQPTHGSVTLNATTGIYTYTPTADYNGADSFVVEISDGKGGTVQSTIALTITPVVDVVNDAVETLEDTAISFNVLTGTNGASADNFESSAAVVTSVTQGANGSVTFSADGTIVYTPNPQYNGPDSFTYTVRSGDVLETATVFIHVNASNDAPIPVDPGVPGQTFDPATGDYAVGVQEDTPVNGRVAASDPDGDDLTYVVIAQPANGTLVFNPDGSYTYTPNADFNGTDSFMVEISDGLDGTVQSTVTLTVSPVADIAADTATTNEDTPVTINVTDNDSFENADFAITAINGATIAQGESVAVTNGSVMLNADGSLSFTPAANFNGATSFSYTVTSGGVTESTTVTVNVTPVNDAPVPSEPIPPTPGQSFDPATGN
ncbi:tandem-95 repeat protein, partial [Enterobacteriaceae bacterium H16N7]|nr:tandem-95 repeat protein [Dryocola clanedunensis]